MNFDQYVDCLALLKEGKTVKILGSKGFKLYVKDLDGNVQECYDNNIELIWKG